jgi:hypothetical protein
MDAHPIGINGNLLTEDIEGITPIMKVRVTLLTEDIEGITPIMKVRVTLLTEDIEGRIIRLIKFLILYLLLV